jgi:hypothetical protein
VSCSRGNPARPPDPLAGRIAAHVREIGSDRYEGRAPGSPGGQRAAAYLEARLSELGLEPAGTKGFRQPVPLVGIRTLPATRLVWTGADRHADGGRSGTREKRIGAGPLPDPARTLTPAADDFIAGWNRPIEKARVEGPAVFVGYGVVDPGTGRDDYAGADLEGRWAVALDGEPPDAAGRLGYAAGQPVSKLYAARSAGAVGLVLLSAEAEWPEPYDLARERRILPGWGPDERGQPLPWLVARAELVARLSAGRNLWEEALDSGFSPRPLPGRIELDLAQEVRRFDSPNLIARLPGSDPALAQEHVCLSAHWDGLGRSGSKIYNGVIDNAVAVGELLETARLAREQGPGRRSLLFFFPTAEEAGLLGSTYFTQHPKVPLADIVGCLNKDGAPEAWGRSTDVVAIAAEAAPPFAEALRSSVARTGLAWSPNPFPSEGFFFRSDHYAFLRAGVPGVLLFLGLGFEGRDPAWGVEQAMLYLKEHYHRSTDDLARVKDWDGPAQYSRLWLSLARDLADGREVARSEIDLGPGD